MEPELEEAIGNILQATQRHGKKCGIYCTSGAQAKHYADMGFDMISVATDVTALQAVMAETVATARGLEKPDFGGRY